MTREQFFSLKVGDKVKLGHRAKTRTVTSVFNDRGWSGAFIVQLSAINGCAKSVNNMVGNDLKSAWHYSDAILKGDSR